MEAHISLLITGGNGPEECHQAVAGILRRMQEEAEVLGVALNVDAEATRFGLKSAVLVPDGPGARSFAMRWLGTLCWRSKSALRRQHKRSNWFVGVFELPQTDGGPVAIRLQDVTFGSFRAGGPGGQHQNTTDSAVRATHGPSGLTAVARESRSQHRNKALALQRLQMLSNAHASAARQAAKDTQHQLHHAVAFGSPVRTFIGPDFREVVT